MLKTISAALLAISVLAAPAFAADAAKTAPKTATAPITKTTPAPAIKSVKAKPSVMNANARMGRHHHGFHRHHRHFRFHKRFLQHLQGEDGGKGGAQSGAKTVTVPYRANRAVIFDSNLFHKTDTIRFAEGYENRRLNITMLYGRRAR